MFDFFKNHPLLLAPMAGVSDEAFRSLCLEQGASLSYTEMVSAKGLSFANEKTRDLLQLAPEESQVAVQIFGHEPDTMAREACWIREYLDERLAYIDINMGCPARKIVRKGDGCALMLDPELAQNIMQAVSNAIDVPVTVKFRKGFYLNEETAVEFAKRAEASGISAVAIHGRFAEQYYQGKADWKVIGDVKQALSIPVIGNGDVKTGEDAFALRQQTGCDAIMIGRAAEGNPWIFRQAKAALNKDPIPPNPTFEERIAMARRHAGLLERREGNNIVRMRKHAMWYVAGLSGATEARRRINSCITLADFEKVFDDLFSHQQEHLFDGAREQEGTSYVRPL